jgi:hypothetical protein
MNLDDLFEDLEAQFDGYLAESKPTAGLERSHLMQVWHGREQQTQLAAPILGSDFVAGMALGDNVFRLIRLEAVSKIALIELADSGIPASRYVPLEASEFLERLPLPFSVRWQSLEYKLPGYLTVLGLLGQTLIVESVLPENFQLLPLSAVAHLELIDVENFDSRTRTIE